MQSHHVTNGRGSTDIFQHIPARLVALLSEPYEGLVGFVDMRIEPLPFSSVRKVASELKKSPADGAVPESRFLGAGLEAFDLWNSATDSSRIPTYARDT